MTVLAARRELVDMSNCAAAPRVPVLVSMEPLAATAKGFRVRECDASVATVSNYFDLAVYLLRACLAEAVGISDQPPVDDLAAMFVDDVLCDLPEDAYLPFEELERWIYDISICHN